LLALQDAQADLGPHSNLFSIRSLRALLRPNSA
jgi:hypothetical protein